MSRSLTRESKWLPEREDAAPPISNSSLVAAVRWQIFLYIFLWLIEGALRKWFLPGLSNPLLVVRDPLAITIYVTALAANAFPMNRVIGLTVIIGLLSFVAGFLVTGNLLLTMYGFRSNFLHLPLIFVIGATLRPVDVKRVGVLFLFCAIPMALIMAKQFNSGIDDWWNLGAGGGRQIVSVDGRIRAAGTFSFISGPVTYFTIVAAFLVASVSLRRWFPWWLTMPAAGATMLAAAVAGSRSLLVAIAVVLVLFIVGCAICPRVIPRAGFIVGGGLLVFLAVSSLDVYQAGKSVTSERAVNATASEGGLEGFLNRAVDPLLITPGKLAMGGLLGRGLGSGTVAANSLTSGREQPVWAENEWERVLAESGPVLGLAFIALRVAMVFQAFLKSLVAGRSGNTISLVLFGGGAMGLLTGQFGQPTSQGAATIAMGLCLASLSIQQSDLMSSAEIDAELGEAVVPEIIGGVEDKKVRRGRAPYAASLHHNDDAGNK